MDKKKVVVFIVSFVLLFVLLFARQKYVLNGVLPVSSQMHASIILNSLTISLAITFSLNKKFKGYLTALSIISLGSIASFIITTMNEGGLNNYWWDIYLIFLILYVIFMAAFITFIINPLIRKFYLKQT